MNAIEYRFIEPLDVLFLRGNKLFGDPGSHGESLVPPWPSVAAGAIRSRMLAEDRADGKPVDLAAYARGEIQHPVLGTPTAPGPFQVAGFQLARRLADGRVESLSALPADLVAQEDETGRVSVRALVPTRVSEKLASSAPLPCLPVLAETTRSKPAAGYWLTESGWKKYLAGHTPDATDLVKTADLWQLDHRVGVGLDMASRRAAEGRLFTAQAVAMKPGVGFLAAISGAKPPSSGTIRLGGDGRAAALHVVDWVMPEPDYDAIIQARRCRMVLTTPGLFRAGWLADGLSKTQDNTYRFNLHGIEARLVCAAVPRAEVISGWDLANQQPKTALRAAPAGSVYWLEDLEATPDALRKLAAEGLWGQPCEDAARRVEGFNRLTLAAWSEV